MKLFLFLNYPFILAVFAFITALGFSIFIHQDIINLINPAMLFLPCIILFAWGGGYKPGILVTIISGVIINYLFLSPNPPFIPTEPILIIRIILFLLEGILISLIIERGRRRHTHDYHRHTKNFKEKIIKLEQEYAIAKKEIRARDEFLSIASHELKTPLTSMLLQTQAALYSIRNVSLAHFSINNLLKMLESVENQTKRLSKMINDLLSTSLITTGNLQLVYEKVDLDTVVSEVIEEFSTRTQREGYEVIYTKKDSIFGQWDKIRIHQAISNLISNAIKYGNRKPINVEIRKENNNALFIVTDHGIGIPKEQHEKIFGLFERAVSPTEYKGLGVGLYITKKIVEAHGGSIIVSSKVGKESIFTIKLPLQTI
ncbi:HAMP domain-containing histidine kinase [Patescibacteria group bacterium]|nr:HAMP domain-containing histidine kinase [Patescibacteria group bacterium]MBU4099244.1 HAMP domain-containing histidine kinase [Patescibacteria group bacterium]